MEPSGVFSITALYVFAHSTFLSFAQLANTKNTTESKKLQSKTTKELSNLKIKVHNVNQQLPTTEKQ